MQEKSDREMIAELFIANSLFRSNKLEFCIVYYWSGQESYSIHVDIIHCKCVLYRSSWLTIELGYGTRGSVSRPSQDR
jgi:hypothetical protein